MFKVPEKQTQQRLNSWKKLRDNLETSHTPLEDVANFFNQFPKTKVYTDPYDQTTWPTAWELIEENEYCPFNFILGMCYTLQLCDRFRNITPCILISIDTTTNNLYYMLIIGSSVYGYNNGWQDVKSLPKSLKTIKIYAMPSLH